MVTLDGHPLSYFGLMALKGHSNPNPGTREKTLVIPSKHGAWDFGADMDIIQFNFPMAFVEVNRTALQKRIRDFTAFLFDAYGKPRTFKLVFDYESDKFYMVRYSGQIKPERLFGLGTFELLLTAFDPIAKFIVPSDEITMDSDIPVLSDITLDAIYKYTITSAQTINIINDGTLAVRPTIVITGTADSLTLSINGKSFSFGPISSPVEVNGENYTVKVNSVSSLSAMTGDDINHLILMPGDNAVTVSGSSLNIDMTFKFNHQYM